MNSSTNIGDLFHLMRRPIACIILLVALFMHLIADTYPASVPAPAETMFAAQSVLADKGGTPNGGNSNHNTPVAQATSDDDCNGVIVNGVCSTGDAHGQPNDPGNNNASQNGCLHGEPNCASTAVPATPIPPTHVQPTNTHVPANTATNPPQATSTRPPRATSTNPPQSTATNPPQATSTRPPQSTSTNPPATAQPTNTPGMTYTLVPSNTPFTPPTVHPTNTGIPTVVGSPTATLLSNGGGSQPTEQPAQGMCLNGKYIVAKSGKNVSVTDTTTNTVIAKFVVATDGTLGMLFWNKDCGLVVSITLPNSLQSDLYDVSLSGAVTKQLTDTTSSESQPRLSFDKESIVADNEYASGYSTVVELNADGGNTTTVDTLADSPAFGSDDSVFTIDEKTHVIAKANDTLWNYNTHTAKWFVVSPAGTAILAEDLNGSWYMWDLQSNTTRTLPAADSYCLDPSGTQICQVKGGKLYVAPLNGIVAGNFAETPSVKNAEFAVWATFENPKAMKDGNFESTLASLQQQALLALQPKATQPAESLGSAITTPAPELDPNANRLANIGPMTVLGIIAWFLFALVIILAAVLYIVLKRQARFNAAVIADLHNHDQMIFAHGQSLGTHAAVLRKKHSGNLLDFYAKQNGHAWQPGLMEVDRPVDEELK